MLATRVLSESPSFRAPLEEPYSPHQRACAPQHEGLSTTSWILRSKACHLAAWPRAASLACLCFHVPLGKNSESGLPFLLSGIGSFVGGCQHPSPGAGGTCGSGVASPAKPWSFWSQCPRGHEPCSLALDQHICPEPPGPGLVLHEPVAHGD